jgi:DNA polymerase I-like protein with 3'-5' exonuclease and polymerase domains
MFAPECAWKLPEMVNLPDWGKAQRIAVDVETYDPYLKKFGPSVRRGGYIVGVSFAIEDGPKHYLPFRHKGGDNLDVEMCLAYLRDNAARFKGIVVGANLSYDLDYLWEEGIFFHPNATYGDIQIADPLIYELHNSYSLDNIAKRWGFPGKDESMLEKALRAFGLNGKGDLWKLPGRYVGAYAEADVTEPLKVLRKQERRLDAEGLWDIWTLESNVLPINVKYRRRGVLVDFDHVDMIEAKCLKEEQECVDVIKHITGYTIGVGNFMKAAALKPVLESVGIKVGMTAKGLPNIDQEFLKSIKHPVADAMLQARKVNKRRTTFVHQVREHAINGRIHCTLRQIAMRSASGDDQGARFGRMSCVMPNLQQQPNDAEWRAVYIPEHGAIWGCNDYSQQEPRWTTHFAAITGKRGAEDAAKAYREDPTLDNHDFMTYLVYGITRQNTDREKYEKLRKNAKIIFLGLCYGMGGAKLATGLGLPTRWTWAGKRGSKFFANREDAKLYRAQQGFGRIWQCAGTEAQAIIDQFNDRVPYVKELAHMVKTYASSRGYITTAGGRRLNFPEENNGDYGWTHKALNRLIQGSSGDQTKRAMVMIDQIYPDYFMQLQVHDELNGSFESVKQAKEVAHIMRTCMDDLDPAPQVPFKVDTEYGPNWGDLEVAA